MPTAITASMYTTSWPARTGSRWTFTAIRQSGMSPTPFVKMLWERGSLCEREVIARLELPSLDLSGYTGEEKERLTLEAMQRGEPLIYTAGRLVSMFDEYQSRETAKHVLRAMKENARLGSGTARPRPTATRR